MSSDVSPTKIFHQNEQRGDSHAGEPCLVIGGGLIGSHVAIALARQGFPVTVVSRSFSDWITATIAGGVHVRTVKMDIVEDRQRLGELVAEAEVVFFLAGDSTPALSDTDAARSISALLTPVLVTLDVMNRSETRRLVIASSGGTVYGRVSKLPTDEEQSMEPISVHGVNCAVSEEYTRFYAREHGLEPVILRFSNVYGPGGRVQGGQGVIQAWCENLARGEPAVMVGDGSVRRDFLYVADAAEAAISATYATPGAGIYNVGSGASVSLNELSEILERVSGRSMDIQRLPARAIDVPVTQLDSGRLQSATGWEPRTSLTDGLGETWRWTASKAPSTAGR
jgi:UDP-glucose 4-epimerase